MRRVFVLMVVGLLLLTACEHDKDMESEGPLASCGPAPSALGGTPMLPANFPSPGEVTYTGATIAGPSTEIMGYWTGDLDAAFAGYKNALTGAGYQLTKTEMDAHDAEVNFSHSGTTGQVKLQEQCAGRVKVSITARPG